VVGTQLSQDDNPMMLEGGVVDGSLMGWWIPKVQKEGLSGEYGSCNPRAVRCMEGSQLP